MATDRTAELSSCPLTRANAAVRERFVLSSAVSNIGPSAERLLEVARRCGFDEDGLFDLEVIVREALSNAVVHGNDSDPAKRVRVRCYGAPGIGVLLLVRDEGPGFDPEALPDPTSAAHAQRSHGRGVFLIREMSDAVAYRRAGRELVLYKGI